MLPKFLTGSYQRYKADTAKFSAWLLETAKKCGLKDDVPDFDPNSQYVIPVKLFPVCADVIANANIPVPEAILAIAQRVISLRKRFARFFQPKARNDTESYEKHAHFIKVLEGVLERLPRESKESNNADGTKKKKWARKRRQEESKKHEVSKPDLSNQFSVLSMADEGDEFEDAKESLDFGDATSTSRRSVKGASISNREDQFDDKLTEDVFAAFCLMEDLNNLRDFIRETWTEYKFGRLDIMTAAVTTNSAIGLARSQIQGFLASYTRWAEFMRLGDMLMRIACLERNLDYAARQRPQDPFNMDLYDIAEWSMTTTSLYLEAFTRVMQPGESIQFYRQGHWGTIDKSKARKSKSSAEKFDEDRESVLAILPEYVFLKELKWSVPIFDEISSGILKMVETREAPLWLSFGTQVLLDIQNVLGQDSIMPFADMCQIGSRLKASLKSFHQFTTTVSSPTWDRSNERHINEFIAYIDTVTVHDPSIPIKQCLKNDKHHEEFFLYKKQAVLAGLIVFDFNHKMQTLGLAIINAWGTVLPLLYLQNLIRVMPGNPSVSWPDLDLFLDLHDQESIFLGGAPKDLDSSFTKLQLSLGMSASALAQGGRRIHTGIHNTRGPRAIRATTLIAFALKETDAKSSTMPMTVASVTKLLEYLESKSDTTASKTLTMSTTSKSIQLLNQKWRKTHKLSPLQLLTALRSRLANEEPRLLFDYIGMHLRCFEFLGLLRDELNEKFVQYLGPNYMQEEFQLPFVVTFVMHTAIMSAAEGRRQFAIQPGMMLVSKMVIHTADFLNTYTKTKGDLAWKELKAISKRGLPERFNAADAEKEKNELYWFSVAELLAPDVDMNSILQRRPVA